MYVNPVPIMEAAGFFVVNPTYKNRGKLPREVIRLSGGTNFTSGAFGQRSGTVFINRRFLPAFISDADDVAWPTYCRADSYTSVQVVRRLARQALGLAST